MTPAAARACVEEIQRDAVLSDCAGYRYRLRRTWDGTKPQALFVMLNPSTADAETDDPTIRSCTRLCRAWGHGGFVVVNLFAFRATDPRELRTATDPVGELNDAFIEDAAEGCEPVICAWGAHPFASKRAGAVLNILHRHKGNVYCLGLTKKGHPRHPLYVRTGTPLVPFQGVAP